MRHIINSTYISLDGVIQDPQDWPDNGIEGDGTGMKVQTELLFGCELVVCCKKESKVFERRLPAPCDRHDVVELERVTALAALALGAHERVAMTVALGHLTTYVGRDVAGVLRGRPARCPRLAVHRVTAFLLGHDERLQCAIK